MTHVTYLCDARPIYFRTARGEFTQPLKIEVKAMLLEYETRQSFLFRNGFLADMLFCNLTPKSLEYLTRIKHKKQFPKGATVISEGAPPTDICVLLKGQARIVFNTKLQNGIVNRFAEPNEIFGLTETISNSPFEISIETITPCLFETISGGDFLRFLHKDSRVCFRLVQLIGFNLEKSYRSLVLGN